jgi:hypothetical protein
MNWARVLTKLFLTQELFQKITRQDALLSDPTVKRKDRDESKKANTIFFAYSLQGSFLAQLLDTCRKIHKNTFCLRQIACLLFLCPFETSTPNLGGVSSIFPIASNLFDLMGGFGFAFKHYEPLIPRGALRLC